MNITSFFKQSRHVLFYGFILAILVFVLKWLQWKYLIADHANEIYLGLLALFFTVLGVWIASQLATPKIKTVIVEKEIYVDQTNSIILSEDAFLKFNLTKREFDVLKQILEGYSNAVIAKNLFLSVSTIKTHASNLYEKMGVNSRAQLIVKAKKMKEQA